MLLFKYDISFLKFVLFSFNLIKDKFIQTFIILFSDLGLIGTLKLTIKYVDGPAFDLIAVTKCSESKLVKVKY